MNSEPSASSKPGRVAFRVSAELQQRAASVVASIRSDRDKRKHVPALIEVVLEMTDAGLHYYFLHPLERAGVGAVTRRAVELAIGTAGRTLPMVVRKTVGSLNDEQISSIAEFLDEILVQEEAS